LASNYAEHSRKLLDWQDRVKVAEGAAKGLLYLHENNIIHRDMTPNNILLTHDYDVLVIICTVNTLGYISFIKNKIHIYIVHGHQKNGELIYFISI